MGRELELMFTSQKKSQIINSDVIKCHGIFVKPRDNENKK